MRPRSFLSALAILALAACDPGPTGPAVSELDTFDYSMILFGESGTALESTLGPQGMEPFDGRSEGFSRLPAELALTDAQKAAMAALREAFRTANADRLAELKSIFETAKAARKAGQPREEVRAIMVEARSVAQSLKPAVQALHEGLKAILTPEQKAWLEANRPQRGQGRGPRP